MNNILTSVTAKVEFSFYTIIIIVAAALVSALLCCVAKYGKKKYVSIVLKAFAVIYVLLINFRFFTNDSFVYIINGGYYGQIYYTTSDYLVSILRWGQYMSYCILPIAVFCKNRCIRNVCIYVCLPFAIAMSICYTANLPYLIDGKGVRFSPPIWAINGLFCLELAIAIMVPLVLRITGEHKFNVKNGKEWLKFLVWTPLLAILLMPSYEPQSLLGISGIRSVGGFGLGHLIWMGSSVAIALALYYYFRWKDYDTRFTVCLLLSLMAFNHYLSIAQMTSIAISITPVQLCNIASILFILVMVTKSRKLFNFVFLANIVGTIIGMLGSGDEGLWSAFWSVRFMYQHTIVLIVPSLMFGLRIFKRFTLKDIGEFLIGIFIYWLFCLAAGTYINSYPEKFQWSANWFYMFDQKYALDYFPLFANIINYEIKIGRCTFYPIYQILVPIVYSTICILFMVVVNWLTRIEDDRLVLREKMFDLLEKRGWQINAPRQFID